VALSERTNDTVIGIGWISAIFWCGSQAKRALTSVEGISLAQYAAFGLGFSVQLMLALAALNQKRTRLMVQLAILFGTWTFFSGMLCAVVIFGTDYRWSPTDTNITLFSVAGIGMTMIYMVVSGKPLSDAAVKGWMNIILKSIPQFMLASKVWADGSGGLTEVAIVTGSLSIISRLGPLTHMLLTTGGVRDEKWLWVTDAVNLASWLSVTVVWFLR
jgi:uncharacterized membrane protein YdcZ (DUF606 family)